MPIAVDYVRCQGSENSLKECLHFSHSYSGCSHDDDVRVRCQPGEYVFISLQLHTSQNVFLQRIVLMEI